MTCSFGRFLREREPESLPGRGSPAGGSLRARSLYERDFYAWTRDQAAHLRAREGTADARGVDWKHVAEEIEDLGSSERSEIESRLGVLLVHLLKWRFQPDARSNSWRATIIEQRQRIARRLRRSPSLRSYPAEVLREEYELARTLASIETDLPPETFPPACPFTADEILDPAFLPEAA